LDNLKNFRKTFVRVLRSCSERDEVVVHTVVVFFSTFPQFTCKKAEGSGVKTAVQ